MLTVHVLAFSVVFSLGICLVAALNRIRRFLANFSAAETIHRFADQLSGFCCLLPKRPLDFLGIDKAKIRSLYGQILSRVKRPMSEDERTVKSKNFSGGKIAVGYSDGHLEVEKTRDVAQTSSFKPTEESSELQTVEVVEYLRSEDLIEIYRDDFIWAWVCQVVLGCIQSGQPVQNAQGRYDQMVKRLQSRRGYVIVENRFEVVRENDQLLLDSISEIGAGIRFRFITPDGPEWDAVASGKRYLGVFGHVDEPLDISAKVCGRAFAVYVPQSGDSVE